jgi:hypothetical protein
MEKSEERQNIKKVWILLGINIAILAGGVIIGIPVMIRLAIWWGDVKTARSPAIKTDLIPPAPPKILLEFESTNSASQKIAGLSEPGSTVAVGMNGSPLGNSVADSAGKWIFANVILNEGINRFTAVAVDEAGNKSVESDPVSMAYQSKSPDLTVESPADRQVVSGKSAVVEVKGFTVPSARLTINDRVVVVGNGGRFTTSVNLSEGENVLVVVAADASGNQTRKELVVEYRR